MDRFALFIDAGHLLAEGGSLCCGTKSRGGIHCDFQALIAELGRFCSEQCALPILRTYWYDGAKDAVPTPEQLLIAQLPRTKLRLGRLSGGKQKGVDSLIVRDLMTLARERAVATAFLLGGDEDLREGMVAAQEMGVAVNVIGIPTTHIGKANQAESLIREADEHLVLPTAFLARFITLRPAAAAPAPAAAALAVAAPSAEPSDHLIDSATVTMAASEFALTWHAARKSEEVERLMADLPKIPQSVDTDLLRAVESAIGKSLRDRDDLRKDVRAAFWQVIKTLYAGSGKHAATAE